MAERAASSRSNVSETIRTERKRKFVAEAASSKNLKKPKRTKTAAAAKNPRKWKRTKMATALAKHPKKRKRTKIATATTTTTCSYLPEELWEHIFKFFIDGDNSHYSNIDKYGTLVYNSSVILSRYRLKSLSLVSKQFLSITNRLRFSVTISDKTIPFLHCLFERFPNVTSLKTTLRGSDLDALLTQLSTFPVDLKSLSIFDPITFPEDGLRALSQKITNLTSLTCYRIPSSRIHKNDLSFIADCFPLLEELIVTDIGYPRSFVLDGNDQSLRLFKLRKIALSRNFIGNHSINDLCKNCNLLQEVKVIDYPQYAKVIGGGPRCCGASRCCRPLYRGVSRCSRSRYHGASGCCCSPWYRGASRCRR